MSARRDLGGVIGSDVSSLEIGQTVFEQIRRSSTEFRSIFLRHSRCCDVSLRRGICSRERSTRKRRNGRNDRKRCTRDVYSHSRRYGETERRRRGAERRRREERKGEQNRGVEYFRSMALPVREPMHFLPNGANTDRFPAGGPLFGSAPISIPRAAHMPRIEKRPIRSSVVFDPTFCRSLARSPRASTLPRFFSPLFLVGSFTITNDKEKLQIDRAVRRVGVQRPALIILEVATLVDAFPPTADVSFSADCCSIRRRSSMFAREQGIRSCREDEAGVVTLGS